jgi:ATP-dependent DNA helicase PIF1
MDEQKKLQPKKSKNSKAISWPEDEPVPATKTGQKHESAMVLSEEQSKVLNMIVNGRKSVFFTGSAGKSALAGDVDLR